MLDSFQFIIGIYLLTVAVRGKGQLYNFDVPKEHAEKARRMLRTFYFVLSGVAFLDGGVSILQNTLYTRTLMEDGAVQIAKNTSIDAPAWVTYPLLTAVIYGLITLFLLLVGILLLMVRKYRKQQK